MKMWWGAEGATPECSGTVLLARPVMLSMSGLRVLPQEALSLLRARLAQAWSDLGESPYSSALTDHTQPTNPQGFVKMWTEKAPRSWQEGLTVRGRKIMKGGRRHFSAEQLDVKLGMHPSKRALAQQPNPGARNLLQPKLPEPRLAHPSS